MRYEELRREVAGTARKMVASGLVTGTSGNVSARTPDGGVLVTPSGLDYALLEAEDIVLVDASGNLLEGDLEQSSETPMHTGIYRARPNVGGIVHTHAPYSTALACLGWEIPPVHYMLAALSSEGLVPVAAYATYGTEELARNCGEALGDAHNACLLQNHGTIAVGSSPGEAYSRTEILEEMAALYYRTRAAGEPILLSPKQIGETAEKISSYGQSKPSSADVR